MTVNLIELSTKELLKKFGAGDHKPGSGSAAALQSMVSAQLIRTVIDLTKPRKETYQEILPKLVEIEKQIDKNIYPALVKLFQQDSDQFDKTIKYRRARNNEKNLTIKSKYQSQAKNELKIATEIPIKIADLSIELGEFARFIFDHGFMSARGDSCVALNNAVASIAGCIAIVELNLLSFEHTEWTENIGLEVERLKGSLKELSNETIIRQNILSEQVSRSQTFFSKIEELQKRIQSKANLSNNDIENIARSLQILIWKYKGVIWKKRIIGNQIEILQPDKILKTLGYQFQRYLTLGFNIGERESFEVAGEINKPNKTVMISMSKTFSVESQNFTIAHELGHVLLHNKDLQHREKPLEGNRDSPRELVEQQADKFAACFLLPRKQVVEKFRAIFGMDKFIINDDTVFSINEKNASEFRKKCGKLRGLSSHLASLNFYQGEPIESISKQFGVSELTMAIRLEELKLVEF